MGHFVVPGYRLQPEDAGDNPAHHPDATNRWLGIRQSDGARVVVIVDPAGRAGDYGAYLGAQIDGMVPVDCAIDLAGGAGPTGREDPMSGASHTGADLQGRASRTGSQPAGGVALVYVDPPRRRLPELIEVSGELPLGEVLQVLLRGCAVVQAMRAAGLRPPALRPERIGIGPDSSIWLCESAIGPTDVGDEPAAGSAGREPPLPSAVSPSPPTAPDLPGDLDERVAIGGILGLARQLTPPESPATLGLDDSRAEWPALRALVETLDQAVRAGASLTLDDVAAGLRAVGKPQPLHLPPGWDRPAPEELVSRMRALATELDDAGPKRSDRSRLARGRSKASGNGTGWSARRPASTGPESLAGLGGGAPAAAVVPVVASTAAAGWPDRTASPSRSRPSTSARPGRPRPRASGPARSRHEFRMRRRVRTTTRRPRAAGRAARAWNWLAEAPVRYLPVMGLALLLAALLVIRGGAPEGPAGPSQAKGTSVTQPVGTAGTTSGPADPGATNSLTTAATSSPAGPGSPGANSSARASTLPTATMPTATMPTSAGPGSPRAGSSGSPTPGTHTGTVPDPLADLTGPLTYPTVVAQALADLRAEAWATLDIGVVRELNAPGSAALAADTAAVTKAAAGGLRYTGLAFVVRTATARHAPGAGDERVLLDAQLDTSAFTITGPDGRATTTPGRAAAAVRLDLRWSGERWQIAATA